MWEEETQFHHTSGLPKNFPNINDAKNLTIRNYEKSLYLF